MPPKICALLILRRGSGAGDGEGEGIIARGKSPRAHDCKAESIIFFRVRAVKFRERSLRKEGDAGSKTPRYNMVIKDSFPAIQRRREERTRGWEGERGLQLTGFSAGTGAQKSHPAFGLPRP
jgi:hypothetical protein